MENDGVIQLKRHFEQMQIGKGLTSKSACVNGDYDGSYSVRYEYEYEVEEYTFLFGKTKRWKRFVVIGKVDRCGNVYWYSRRI